MAELISIVTLSLFSGDSSWSNGGWKDNHDLLLHFSGKSFLGYFPARVSFYGSGSRLRFVGGIEESQLEVLTWPNSGF